MHTIIKSSYIHPEIDVAVNTKVEDYIPTKEIGCVDSFSIAETMSSLLFKGTCVIALASISTLAQALIDQPVRTVISIESSYLDHSLNVDGFSYNYSLLSEQFDIDNPYEVFTYLKVNSDLLVFINYLSDLLLSNAELVSLDLEYFQDVDDDAVKKLYITANTEISDMDYLIKYESKLYADYLEPNADFIKDRVVFSLG